MCINKFHLSIYIYSLPNTRWVTRGFILYYTSHTGVQSDVLPSFSYLVSRQRMRRRTEGELILSHLETLKYQVDPACK